MNAQNMFDWKNIKERESTAHFLSAQDNQLIYLKKWHAKTATNKEKVVFLFHDLCQYHGRFEALIKWVQERDENITFVAMDLVGHGLSSGTRGHFDQFEYLVRDILYLLENEKKEVNQEWFLLAHGLGGLILLDLVNKYPAAFASKINGLILSNFIIDLVNKPLAKWLSVPFSKINFASKIRLQKIFTANEMTNDHDEVIGFEKDSLIVHRPTWAALEAIREKATNIYRDAYFLDWPILVLQSGNDKYLRDQGMEFFLMGIKKNLLTEKHYSNLKHDLYNEKEKVTVFNDLLEWINTHEKNS